MLSAEYILDMPEDVIKKICLVLSIVDLMSLCKINSQIKKIIWDNDYFWKEKYLLEYGNNIKDYTESWRKLYLEQKAFAYGDNNYALLGVNKTKAEQDQISLLSIKNIAYNYGHVVALTNSGEVYVWGMCDTGSGIELYNETKIYEPVKINFEKNVTAKYVHAGNNYMYTIDKNNNLWGSGKLSYLVPSLFNDRRVLPVMDKLSDYTTKNKEIFTTAIEVVSSYSHLLIKTIDMSYYLLIRNGKDEDAIKLEFDYGIKQCCLLDDCILILDNNGKFWTSSVFYGKKPYEFNEVFEETYYMGEFLLTKVFDTTVKTIIADKSGAICLVTPIGHLYVVGNNSRSCFGSTLPRKLIKPVKIENLICKKVSVSLDKTVIIDDKSNVHILGQNQQLIDNIYCNNCLALPLGYILCGYIKIN